MEVKKRLRIFEILIFLGFFDFLGRGTWILVLAALLLLTIENKREIRVSPVGGWMIIFTLAYSFWILGAEVFNIRGTILPITALLIFFAGKKCVKPNEGGAAFQHYFLIMALGAACYGLINMLLNILAYGWNFNSVRILKDLWSTQDTLATGQSALFVPLVGMLYYILVYFNKDKTKNVKWFLYLVLIVLGIIYNIMTASRYILFVSVLILLFCLVIDILMRKTHSVRFLIQACVLIATCVVAYNVNLFGVKSFWENSSLLHRMDKLESLEQSGAYSSQARVRQITDVLNNFHLYLYGGKPTGYPFIHNAWLSVLNYGGLFLFIPFTILTITSIGMAYKVVRKSDKTTAFLIIGIFIAIYGFFMIEPLFEGARWLFLAFSFMLGMLDTMNQSKNKSVLFERK